MKIISPVLIYYKKVWGNKILFDQNLVESWCTDGTQIEIEVKDKIEAYLNK